MSKSDKDSKASISSLVSPLKEFADSGLLIGQPETKTDELITSTNNYLKIETINRVASELLSVQAELLTGSRGSDPSYENLILLDNPLHNNQGVRIDYYDNTTQSINICPNDAKLKLGQVLAHEMTHAIDDIFDDRKSGDRVLETLKLQSNGQKTDISFQKRTIALVSQLLPPDMQTTFKYSYYKLATQGSASFADACKSAEQKTLDAYPNPTRLNRQEKAASVLLGEFASFTFEAFFTELQQNPTAESKFLENYSNLNPTSVAAATSIKRSERIAGSASDTYSEEQEIKNTAQEVIAVSIFEINKHLINHIESGQGKSTSEEIEAVASSVETKRLSSPSEEDIITTQKSKARTDLLTKLIKIQEVITPAYTRAQAKIEQYNQSLTIESDSKDPTASLSSPDKKRRTISSTRIHDHATEFVEKIRLRSKSVDSLPSILSPTKNLPNLHRSKSEPSLQR